MKRFLFLIVLVMVVSWLAASHRTPFRRSGGPPRYEVDARDAHAGHRLAAEARRETRRALAEARNEVRQALFEARDEVRQAFAEARDEVHAAFAEAKDTLISDEAPHHRSPAHSLPAVPAVDVEVADDIPVAIVPGTRVTHAVAKPPALAPPALAPPVPPAVPVMVASDASAQSSQWTVTGLLSATEDRAVADARRKLADDIAAWLRPDVPDTWTPPARLLDAMMVGSPRIKSIKKDYGDLFEATLTVSAPPQTRARMIEVYNRQLVERRLMGMGAALAFVLICLAAVSGYIRADEATKGYYTNRLRMLAAAGVGASGVVIYQLIG